MRTETVHAMRLTATDADGNDHFLDAFYDNVISEDASGEEITTKGPTYVKTEDGREVTKVADGKYKVVATGLELVLKGPKFVKPVAMESFFQKLNTKTSIVTVQPAPETQESHGRILVWNPHRQPANELVAETTIYTHESAATGWDDVAELLEAQFAKIGELLTSTYANQRFRRIYFDFMPDTGRVLGIPCAGDITKRNNFPMSVEVVSSFLSDLYDELPESEDERDGDDPVWLKAFDANVALFRAALMKALASPSSQEVLSRLRNKHKVDCFLQISDSDTDIEKLAI